MTFFSTPNDKIIYPSYRSFSYFCSAKTFQSMKKQLLLSTLLTLATGLEAQNTIRVDIDMTGRQTAEVTEPEFTRWESRKDFTEDTFETAGVSFRLASEHKMRGDYAKAFVQSKIDNCRLTGDGICLDPKDECGSFTLYIKGLAPGQHNIQTYHNVWDDPTKFAAWPITVSLGGSVVHQSIPQSLQVAVAANATVLTTNFTVTSAEEEVAITFSTSDSDEPANKAERSKFFRSPSLNGFILDGASTVAQAKSPVPATGDLHVDADNGTFTLSWQPASKDVTAHRLYFGTDSAQVVTADESSPCMIAVKEANDTSHLASGLNNLETYYWRVDETAGGTTTRGDVWKFRPRHLAFPGAEGYGRFAQGGRGGKVVYVTNTNSSGPGSFREAVNKGGEPRTILFMVSGIIDLQYEKFFGDKNITIAGQTAPGKGICLAHSDMGLDDDNICRFMRFRRGKSEKNGNAMGVTGGNHTIVDHTSTSWGTDETVSGRGAKNVTFQYSMISEALGISHGFAASIGGDVGSYHHNFLVNCSGRNWSMAGGLDGNGYYSGRLDLLNNVCYNWWKRATDGGAHEVNFVGNYYKMGPDTNKKLIFELQLEGVGKGTQSAYVKGNIREDYKGNKTGDVKGDTYNFDVSGGQVLDWKPFVDEPFFPSYATIHTAEDAYKIVLSNMGANQPVLDDHDRRNVQECLNRSWTYKGKPGYRGHIDTELDAGGFEVYPETSWSDDFDTDLDGLPNWWEQLIGTNVNSPADDFSDSNADPDGDGFTQLEDYLNFMAEPHLLLKAGEQGTVNLKDLFAGFTASPEFSFDNTSDCAMFSIQNDTMLVVNATKNGIVKATVKVRDAEGSTYQRGMNIGITDAVPSTGIATAITDSSLSSYEVYTLDGKKVVDGKADGRTVRQLPLSTLPSNIYVLKTTDTNGKRHNYKIIK